MVFVCVLAANAEETAIFGPKTYANTSAKPLSVTGTFNLDAGALCNGTATFALVVTNNGVSSATIVLNDAVLAGENQFSVSRTSFETAVVPRTGANTLAVTIKGGARDASLRVAIVRQVAGGCGGPTIAFTSPADGERVTAATILVTGTATGSKDLAVTVNGVTADFDLTAAGTSAEPFRWVVQVPARPGTVTLRAAAVSGSGRAEALRTVSLQVDASAIELSSQPRSGTAPLTSYFHVSDDVSATRYDLDFDGNGSVDWTGATLPDVLPFVYQTPGVYLATVRVQTAAGDIVESTTPVVVQSFAAADSLLRASWSRFTAALAAGDVATAVKELSPAAAAKYRGPLEGIQPALPGYVASLTGFDPVWIAENAAHYLLRRLQDTRTFGYHVYFTRGADGAWKLTQF